ncbi:MAG: hypothetical protein IJX13_05420, partial [Clostridia bacterium]|nr:hypothetical protein [Clostridia bacterium]
NPMTYLPILRDVYSLLQGYDVERSDLSLIADLIQSSKRFLKNLDQPTYKTIADFVGSIGNLLGLPIRNILRDLDACWNFLCTWSREGFADSENGFWADAWEGFREGTLDSIPLYEDFAHLFSS